jgi:hypothetical protein
MSMCELQCAAAVSMHLACSALVVLDGEPAAMRHSCGNFSGGVKVEAAVAAAAEAAMVPQQ